MKELGINREKVIFYLFCVVYGSYFFNSFDIVFGKCVIIFKTFNDVFCFFSSETVFVYRELFEFMDFKY